jgi:hypothetical protein
MLHGIMIGRSDPRLWVVSGLSFIGGSESLYVTLCVCVELRKKCVEKSISFRNT